MKAVLLALFGGALVAIGLPPIGWWPTMLLGIACYVIAAERASHSTRMQFFIGAAFAWGWLAPAMGWMWHLVPGGFVVAPTLFAVMHGIGSVFAARITQSSSWRVLARTTTVALVESARHFWPFGGVPLASLAIGAADTRLAQLARVAGPLGLSWWVSIFGGALALLWLQRSRTGWQSRRVAFGLLGVAVLVQVLGVVAPRGGDTGDSLRIALVQGGGPQGVLAINSNPREVFERHLAATRLLSTADAVDLVVWPENVIDVDTFAGSRALELVSAEAARLGAAFAVGVTEDVDGGFTNAQIVVDSTGQIVSRYDKVRRVPYGEYIPLRSLLRSFGAPVDRVPRDAVAGNQPAVVDVPVTQSANVQLAVAISWEVFFAGRADDGVARGGAVLLNPTNGSSYTGEILQQQQVAASQLRALETGRFVGQAATTGFSVFIDPNGRVLEKIAIGQRAVVFRDVPLREGRTWYSHLGDLPLVLLMLAVLSLMAVRGRPGADQAAADLVDGLIWTRVDP